MTPLTTRTHRSIALALSFGLLLPGAALAQDEPETQVWPTADELRQELQAIGYEFEFDAGNMALAPEWRADLPAVWTLTEPSVVDDSMPEDTAYESLVVRIVDIAGQPVQLFFGAASADQGVGELEAINTVLMEVASRLPDDSGMGAAVWYMNNVWQNGLDNEVTRLPCIVQEFPGGATVVWRGSDGEGLESFFGTVAHFDGTSAEVEQCRALQASAAENPAEPAPEASAEAAVDGSASTTTAVDYTVPADEAVALIDAGEYTVIDVRTPEEYEAAHVVGAVNINVEDASFSERIAELDPGQPYLLYCRSGRRSALAAQQMAEAGFTEIVDAGGLADLARAGAPVE
jgi:rhodanese-related sulfurtransferase